MPKPLKIHIIDDSTGLCQELKGCLSQAGHIVVCSPVGQLLPHTLLASPPQLIVLGASSSQAEGLAIYQKLHNHRQLNQIPIIVVSNDSNLEYEMLDAFDFQVYPFDRERLFHSLKRLSGKEKYLPGTPFDENVLSEVRQFIHNHSGLHFSHHNHRILERGLLRRIQALHIETLSAYLRYLRASPDNYDEVNKLLGLLTVGETSFFRYRSHREALLNYVFPNLLEQNCDQRKLRIWSAGCSTGEEPYSLAILLLEHFPEVAEWDVQIVATDINKRSLRMARQGIYGERSLRMMEEALRERYFEKVDNSFLLSAQVRRMVRFDYLNLQTDIAATDKMSGGEFDLLFCRNVLIYFKLETIQQIVARFSQVLKPQGYLFMGHSETMQNVSDRFQRHYQSNAFFYQLKDPSAVKNLAKSSPPKRFQQANMIVQTAGKKSKDPTVVVMAQQQNASTQGTQGFYCDPVDLYREAMTAFDHEKFSEAARLFDQLLELQPNNPKAIIGQGLILANQGRYSDARICCARALKENDLLPETYLLRGLVLDMEGLLERAQVEYQKVLWLDPGFVMGHYLAAKAHARLGNVDKQQRALRNTIRSLEQAANQSVIPFSGGISREVFLEIVRLELTEVSTM